MGVRDNLRIRKIYTVIAVSLLIMLYIMIFWFSAEDGDSSSAISSRITKGILDLYYRIAGVKNIPDSAVVGDVFSLEGIIRKLAHFGEYMCMGFLSYSLVTIWYEPVWRGRLWILLQLFLSAGLDEFHQSFIPGRHASMKDVMIDMTGGITGMLVIVLWQGVRRAWQHIRRVHS